MAHNLAILKEWVKVGSYRNGCQIGTPCLKKYKCHTFDGNWSINTNSLDFMFELVRHFILQVLFLYILCKKSNMTFLWSKINIRGYGFCSTNISSLFMNFQILLVFTSAQIVMQKLINCGWHLFLLIYSKRIV